MYLRFLVSYFNEEKKATETGFFRSADYVRDFLPISKEDRLEITELIRWFDNNMPVPEFYDDPAKRSETNRTYFWFKDTSVEFIAKMNALASLLEKYGVEVKRIHTKKLPGRLIFEDDCQVAIVPFADSDINIR